MDLKDATLVILTESGAYPSLTALAQSVYDQLAAGAEVDYHVLSDLVADAKE